MSKPVLSGMVCT